MIKSQKKIQKKMKVNLKNMKKGDQIPKKREDEGRLKKVTKFNSIYNHNSMTSLD